MATTVTKSAYSKQLYINAPYYLDAKIQPVANYAALKAINNGQRFPGLEIVVLEDETNDNKQTKYWLVGGTTNSCWQRKEYGGSGSSLTISGDDVPA